MSNFGNKKTNYSFKTFIASFMTIGGLLTSSLPTLAASDYYDNEYRICAAQLLNVGITSEPASQSCAKALRPKELSSCVVKIRKSTKITPVDALASCQRSRLPQDLATCVVDISQIYKRSADPAILTYCDRSLLPVTFAQCVVGLTQGTKLSPNQALDTCIDANGGSSGSGTSGGMFIKPKPNLETKPGLTTSMSE